MKLYFTREKVNRFCSNSAPTPISILSEKLPTQLTISERTIEKGTLIYVRIFYNKKLPPMLLSRGWGK